MNYTEALEYIHKISSEFCKPGLERIRALCSALGNPERDLKFIHIAGTNGKGSTSSMLASVLTEAGYRVGLYTSPYILKFNERMQIAGEPISDELLAELTSRVAPIADALTDKPTEFELITAIAFLYFKECHADVVVLEVGLGGRLDSTNIIENPLLSVITGISLDHTALLGNTVAEIAAEKAGIIKAGSPVLVGMSDPEALGVIERIAAERGSPLLFTDHSSLKIDEATLRGTRFSYSGLHGLEIRLLGLYQPRNSATVIEAVRALNSAGLVIDDGALRRGLAAAAWHARFEIISESPLVIFDGAHNPEGISAAVSSIKHYFGNRRVLVLTGVLRDKDYRKIAGEISSVAHRAYTVTPNNPRALTAEEYAALLTSLGTPAEAKENMREALAAALCEAKKTGTPLVCLGSLYTYSEVIKFLGGM
ncbi:MAG: bifunctional folylpolyglutamate synthase/dihydrofolate synthase [Clostridia bacterium]|nr:bifunctional folylpolyglutamate synthase/dihydrofolate synthase [Clostridia bacterium]